MARVRIVVRLRRLLGEAGAGRGERAGGEGFGRWWRVGSGWM